MKVSTSPFINNTPVSAIAKVGTVAIYREDFDGSCDATLYVTNNDEVIFTIFVEDYQNSGITDVYSGFCEKSGRDKTTYH